MRSRHNARHANRWQSDLSIVPVGSISELRNEIDALDRDIAILLAERLSIVQEIGELKAVAKLPVLDNTREVEVLQRAQSVTDCMQNKAAIERIFQVIMEQSRQLQMHTKSKKARLVYPKVLVIGVGLIGGCLIRQIHRVLPETKVFGCDESDKLLPALAEGLIQKGDSDFVKLLPKASLIVLASSPDTNIQLLKQLAPQLKRGQLVIDVTSTKVAICKAAEQLDLNGAEFIGGHPFMGSEKKGFEASSEVKVDGSSFCLCPTSKSSEVSISRITRWLSQLGFEVEELDAEAHDAIAANMSHLVQLIAIALGSSMKESLTAEQLTAVTGFSGKTFRELRRLMNSPADMWFEITQQNSDQVIRSISELGLKLVDIARAIESGDRERLAKHFARAAQIPQI